MDRFLRERHILGDTPDEVSQFLAAAIADVKRLPLPDDFYVKKIDPEDKDLARQYYDLVAKSLRPSPVDFPYGNPNRDESQNSYYIGLLGHVPVSTMSATNFAGQGEVVLVDRVTTALDYRGRKFAGIVISHVLHRDFLDYNLAFLSPTPDSMQFYKRLGFSAVGNTLDT